MKVCHTDYYELHVTFLTESPEPPSFVPRGWRFSRIDGDHDYGDGVKSYLTTQKHIAERLEDLIVVVERVADALRALGFEVLRTKVERVVYDARHGFRTRKTPTKEAE